MGWFCKKKIKENTKLKTPSVEYISEEVELKLYTNIVTLHLYNGNSLQKSINDNVYSIPDYDSSSTSLYPIRDYKTQRWNVNYPSYELDQYRNFSSKGTVSIMIDDKETILRSGEIDFVSIERVFLRTEKQINTFRKNVS